MYSAINIASRFIALGIGYGGPITQIRIQRLLYLSQGIHLARFNTPLFGEAIECWSYGPVIPEVQKHFVKWGNKPITEITGGGLFLTQSATETIITSWDIGSRLSDNVLSNWSHSEGSPWQKTYSPFYKKIISMDLMRSYFLKTVKINPHICTQ